MSTIIAFPQPWLEEEDDPFLTSNAIGSLVDAAASAQQAEQLFLSFAFDRRLAAPQRCEAAAHLAATLGNPRLCDIALEQLDSPSEVDRQVAALLLGYPGNLRAIFPLVALLDDQVFEVRCAAVRGLAGVRDHRVLSFLLGVLDRDDSLVATVLSALKLFPFASTRAVFAGYLDDTDPEVSLIALGAFLGAGALDVTPTALHFLRHPDPRHRTLAVTMLQRAGKRRFLEPLFPLLGDPDPRVRLQTQDAIVAIRS